MRVQLKTIICTTDFSDLSNRSIPYGIALAKEFDAKLFVCHVIGLPSTAIYGEILLDPADHQRKVMDYAHKQLDQLLGQQPINWEALITTGHTADEIGRLVQEKSADLVITATHGRSGLKRLVLGSVTERLMRILSCPLFIVPDPKSDAGDAGIHALGFKRILIGCDFSSDAALALTQGLSLAQEFQSELFLAHVIEKSVYQNSVKNLSEHAHEFQPILRKHIAEKLVELIPKDALNWCSHQVVLLEGQPDEELIRYAEFHNIDLIVLGVRGQTLVEKLFVGSTTDRVVRRSPCPVLSVCTKVQIPDG